MTKKDNKYLMKNKDWTEKEVKEYLTQFLHGFDIQSIAAGPASTNKVREEKGLEAEQYLRQQHSVDEKLKDYMRTTLNIDDQLFKEAVRRTRTMTNDNFNSVRFMFNSGQMVLEVNTPEVGEYREDMAIDYEGDEVKIAFNPDFVLDVLKNIETESTSIILKDAMSPGVLKPYTEAPKDDYINVIMPIRI